MGITNLNKLSAQHESHLKLVNSLYLLKEKLLFVIVFQNNKIVNTEINALHMQNKFTLEIPCAKFYGIICNLLYGMSVV